MSSCLPCIHGDHARDLVDIRGSHGDEDQQRAEDLQILQRLWKLILRVTLRNHLHHGSANLFTRVRSRKETRFPFLELSGPENDILKE